MKKLMRASSICLLIVLFTGSLWAGVTGKIAGVIRDADTNEPLAGANVFLEGTTLGAAADAEGEYAILNIAPGIYTVMAQMMGYTGKRVEMVRVSIDLTTTQDFELEPTAIEGEVVSVIADRELIQKDMTSSMAKVDAEEIENLPIQSINEVRDLQAGVVRDGGDTHVRGGRDGELTYMVDGVAVTSLNGNNNVTVQSDAVAEFQLITGTFNAEYGKAMSGIMNVVTKKGSDKYTGQINASVGDYYSTHDVYDVMDTWYYDPEKGYNVDESSNPLTKIDPMYDLRASLSGPVPLLGDKLTFFTTGRYNTELSANYGRQWYTAAGYPGDSSLVNLNPRTSYSWQSTVTYRPNANFNLTYGFYWDKFDTDRDNTPLNRRYIPDSQRERHRKANTHMLTLNHTLSANTFYEVKFGKVYSYQERYKWKDPYKTPDFLLYYVSAPPGGSVTYVEVPYTDETLASTLSNLSAAGLEYFFAPDPDNPYGYVHPTWNGTRGYGNAQASFDSYHVPNNFNFNKDNYWNLRFDITSQVNKRHQVKAGAEFVQHEYFRENFNLRPATAIGTDGVEREIEPFQPMIPPLSSTEHDKYTMEPREFSAYLQDKMEYSDFIMNLGLRFDYFDANHIVPVDPRDPDIYQPARKEWEYKDWEPAPDDWKIANGIDPDNSLNSTQEAQYIEEMGFVEYTADERRAFMHKQVKAKTQLSPRLGISYPITDRGTIHFSYGHFFQMPQASQLYRNPDYELGSGGSNIYLGNADLEAEKTVQYEIGLQQQLGEDMKVDVTVFYKDIRDWASTNSPLQRTDVSDLHTYYQYVNSDYANVRGITVMFDKRFSNNYSVSLDYSLMFAEGTYSDPTDAFNAITGGQEPARSLAPMDQDRRHSLTGSFSFRTSGWICTVIGRLNSGLPYTPQLSASQELGTSDYVGWTQNVSRRPAISRLDLKLERELFKVAGITNRLYIRVYNLLDQKGTTGVYADTGSPAFNTTITHNLVGWTPSRLGSLEHFLLRPGNYQRPREIQLGYKLSF